MPSSDIDAQRHTSATANTMADVRHEVDRIDRALVKLMAERQTFMDAAARIKSSRDKVYDGERIEQVVSNVLKAAETAGLSAEIAEPVWRLLIAKSIEHEYRTYDEIKPDERDNS